MFKVIDTYFQTPCGSNFWNIYKRIKPEFQKKMTLLEQAKQFLELYNFSDRLFCTSCVTQNLERFGINEKIDPFPSDFEELKTKVREVPAWFLAGSAEHQSLIACSLIQSDNDFLEEPLNLATYPFSAEQCWLLNLIGSHEVKNSRLFSLKELPRNLHHNR